MKILGIDTSGKTASVAITDGEKLLWEKSVYTKLTHSQIILPMVKDALEETDTDFSDLDALAAAVGPGSYTGLRIGVGAVKGICMGQADLKCIPVSTLAEFAYGNVTFKGKIVSLMKARPKVVYVGEFISDGKKLTRLTADRVADEQELAGTLGGDEDVMLTGDNAFEFKEKYFPENDNVLVSPFINNLQRASFVCLAAENNPQLLTDADKLEVSYLQPTKAEKDKAHRN